MASFNKHDVAKELFINKNIPIKDTEEVLEQTFLLVRTMMKNSNRESLDFKNVRIFNFGIFGVKNNRIKYLKLKDNNDTDN